ncbi:hypothetical protein MMB17_08115 [Methylobacterium organophilum]|uniref:hypothetical protein n=1 Tax=Methylobacterium organophilum TaxID=410 RepID=UPI001F147F22|nr:hypothetical protein [Methylobacterium organophilum]UMY19254.1 hypothetical protein MMB17_08115 [Methylobacterium organophilum]
MTMQPRAYGILAQSVVGGGGDGGVARSLLGLFGSVALGGGGGGGSGVSVDNANTVHTRGPNATAIFAQSVGGGGGTGGGFQGAGEETINANVNVGGSGGKGDSGGTVTVSNGRNASVITDQEGAHGIFAQSIGGGGGVGGGFTGKEKSASFDFSTKGMLALVKEMLDVNKIVVKTYGKRDDIDQWLKWYTNKNTAPQDLIGFLKSGASTPS